MKIATENLAVFLWWRLLLRQESLKGAMNPLLEVNFLTERRIIVQSIPPLGQAWFCVALFGLAVLLVAFSLNNTVAVKKNKKKNNLPLLFTVINRST